MNEQELRQAMRATMASAPVPPPMNEQDVLDAALRSQRRRRARWAGAGSALAATAVVALAVVVVAATSGAGTTENIGSPPHPPNSTTTSSSSGSTSGENTEPSWPNGQTDRTASAGPEYDNGVTLLTELDASVPAGYEAPDDLKGTGDLAGAPMKDHQAQYRDTVHGTEVWEYTADLAVTKGNKVGRLLAEVTTGDDREVRDGCELNAALWGVEGACTEIMVDGEWVGVYTSRNPNDSNQFDQWAAYRHDDGTLVIIAQAGYRAFTNFPPLSGLPLTSRQLAGLAADPRFHLD